MARLPGAIPPLVRTSRRRLVTNGEAWRECVTRSLGYLGMPDPGSVSLCSVEKATCNLQMVPVEISSAGRRHWGEATAFKKADARRQAVRPHAQSSLVLDGAGCHAAKKSLLFFSAPMPCTSLDWMTIIAQVGQSPYPVIACLLRSFREQRGLTWYLTRAGWAVPRGSAV